MSILLNLLSGKVCDFCGAQPVRWQYPAHDIAMPKVAAFDINSVEGWLACATCHALIERNAWDALVDQTIIEFKRHRVLPMVHEQEIREVCRATHERFQQARYGEAIAL